MKNDIINKWNEYSLKKQLLILFGAISFGSLIIMSITGILYVIIAIIKIKDELYNNLLAQSTNNLKKISKESAMKFDLLLLKYANNFLNVLANTANDCFREDYPFGHINSYYNWPGQLINPKLNYTYHANISLESSTINVYNKTLYDITSFSQTLSDTINRTASLDSVLIPLYKYNNDFLAGYISTKDSFLRYYPGTLNNTNLSNFINYNPLTDYWYINTINQLTNNIVFASPYYDPIAGQFMITISKKIYKNGVLLGAAGADLVLNTLQNEIKKVTYLEHGRAIMLEISTGIIVADSLTSYSEITTYRNAANLSLSDKIWYSLISSDSLFSSDSYFITSYILPNTNNQYLLLSLALKNDIYIIFQPTLDIINAILIADIISICIVCPIITILLVLLVLWLTNSIVTPIQKLTDDTSKMINNIGNNI